VGTRNLLLVLWAGAAVILAQTPLQRSSTIRTLDQWSRVCETDGMQLWDKSLCGPMVLVDPSNRSSIANRPDPDGVFKPLGTVYVGVLPEQFTPANTSIQWGQGNWSMIMLRFQQTLFCAHRLLRMSLSTASNPIWA
jgi:hypothetical protein